MEKTKLPGLQPAVSRIGLGTWAIGGWLWGGSDEKASRKTIRRALDLGINLIDTAPVYGFGRSEEIVGKAIGAFGNRDRVVISTKVGLEWTADERVFRNSTPARIEKEIDDSLRRLQTDYIDIYFVHWPDPKEPFERTAEALEELRERGKVRVVGVSNYAPAQMTRFRRNAQLSVCQPPYNLFERNIEGRDNVFSYCKENGIALMVYGAICRGLLSGKMDAQTSFDKGDLRSWDPKFSSERFAQYLEAVDRLDDFARKRHGKQVLDLALRWILDRGVEVALWGARRPAQLDPVSAVSDWQLDADDFEQIDTILDETIQNPVGPEFMAPPTRE
jgi:aryl-alcohol dehydrogenase-like predicted oxidoreductase